MQCVLSHPIPWDIFLGIPMGIPFPWTSLRKGLCNLGPVNSVPNYSNKAGVTKSCGQGISSFASCNMCYWKKRWLLHLELNGTRARSLYVRWVPKPLKKRSLQTIPDLASYRRRCRAVIVMPLMQIFDYILIIFALIKLNLFCCTECICWKFWKREFQRIRKGRTRKASCKFKVNVKIGIYLHAMLWSL